MNSVVWYYKELARRAGQQRMPSYVDRFGYGNRDNSGGIDRFRLPGGLRISAEQLVISCIAFIPEIWAFRNTARASPRKCRSLRKLPHTG
jgi:beta-lactamase class D